MAPLFRRLIYAAATIRFIMRHDVFHALPFYLPLPTRYFRHA